MRSLGVDPGLDGGAALRGGGLVIAVWAWTRTARGVRLRGPSGEVVLGSLHEAGEAIAREVGRADRLVLEGLFVPPRWARRASGSDVIALAEAAGEILGPLRAIVGRVERPRAKEWRRVLAAAELDADRAERVAIERARIEGWLPRWTAKEQGAVAEAGAMALWEAA